MVVVGGEVLEEGDWLKGHDGVAVHVWCVCTSSATGEERKLKAHGSIRVGCLCMYVPTNYRSTVPNQQKQLT